jgi:hypothetical protein
MSDPLVSIITPTKGRESFLPHVYSCVNSQDWKNVEWLVEDDSPAPSPFFAGLGDSRVRYRHDPVSRSIGGKRNSLVSRARGEYVVFFDDDDYYSPAYVTSMISAMRGAGADFIKLTAWFLYDAATGSLGYWNLTTKTGLHYVFHEGRVKSETLTAQNNIAFRETHLGFGFSYVFKRSLWGDVQFPDLSFEEDTAFLKGAAAAHKVALVADLKGLCLHTVHRNNSSRCWAQFLLPPFLIDRLFPGAGAFLEAVATADAAQ